MKKKIRIIASAVVCIIGVMAFTGCASWQRTAKNWQSELSGGLNRVVTVYDVNGKKVKEYSGKLDVVHDGTRILFDDENGKRHIIYNTTGTVIVDEQ